MRKNDVYYSYKYPANDPRSSACLTERWYLGVKQTGNELRSYRSTADSCSLLPGSRGVVVLTPPIRRRTLFIQRWMKQPRWFSDGDNGNSDAAPLPSTVPQPVLDASSHALVTTSVTSPDDRSKAAAVSKRRRSKPESTRSRCKRLLQRQRAAKTAAVHSTYRRRPCPPDSASIRHRKHRLLLRRDQERDANARSTTRCQNLLTNGCSSQELSRVWRRVHT